MGSQGSANPTAGPAQDNPNPTSHLFPQGEGTMPAPKMGVYISSSSLLILNGPFRVGNGTGDPGMLQKIQVGGISGKCIGEGPSQHRKVEKTGKTQVESKEKLRKGAAGSWLEFQVGIQALLRNSGWKGGGFAAQSV